MSCAAFLPLLDIMASGTDYIFNAKGISNADSSLLSTIPLFILLIGTIAVDLLTFVSYKRRILQIRLISFSMMLKIGFYGLAAFYILQINEAADFAMTAKATVTFPIIACILSFLAMRGVMKDEALIKSLDRIR